MSRLPLISGRACMKTLAKVGFYLRRQRGSHLILRRDNPLTQIVVPNHKELDKGTLRSIIRQAQLEVDEFIELHSSK